MKESKEELLSLMMIMYPKKETCLHYQQQQKNISKRLNLQYQTLIMLKIDCLIMKKEDW